MRVAIAAGLGLAIVAVLGGYAAFREAPLAPRPSPLAGPTPPPLPVEERVEPELLRILLPENEPAPSIPPLEPRDSRLTVRLFDGVTGDPVAMTVRLWRLGLPEGERWTEGDVVVASISVGKEGRTVGGLAPGRYRLSCPGQRKGAEDPPEFLVRSGDNATEPSLTMPRTLRVHLLVHDEDGGRLETATCQNIISSSGFSGLDTPRWAVERLEKLPDGSLDGGASMSFGIG